MSPSSGSGLRSPIGPIPRERRSMMAPCERFEQALALSRKLGAPERLTLPTKVAAVSGARLVPGSVEGLKRLCAWRVRAVAAAQEDRHAS